MLTSTESQVNSIFLVHSTEICGFDNFTHMFKILVVSDEFTHVH